MNDARVDRLASRLRDAYHSAERITGLTHETYRYPARFSPSFVRTCIEAFSDPGDYVLDPFVGGGTSAVEALATGRRFAGFDVNELALVLTRAKTTPLYRDDHSALRRWLERSFDSPGRLVDDDRLMNVPHGLVQLFSPAVHRAALLTYPRQRDAARAVLLHVGQWALDGRQEPAPTRKILPAAEAALERLLSGVDELMDSVTALGIRPSALEFRRTLRHETAREAAVGRPLGRLHGRFRLVVTSPPYPGVHVLYHRWQVRGRSETAMPYWLADARDGLGPKHYTMGGRSRMGLEQYFVSMLESWSSLRRLLAPRATIVQLIAFSDPETQLPRYLDMMGQAGYRFEYDLNPREWRDVPNRKWYYRTRPERGRAREVLMVHTSA